MSQDNAGVRSIFLHGVLGRRQFKEVLGSLLTGLIVVPKPLWLVSPWVSDFDLLDNRSGEWDMVQPAWGMRVLSFSQLLIDCVEAGCVLTIVTKDEAANVSFLKRLGDALGDRPEYRVGRSEKLHAKGLLTPDWYLSGSMNFTFSGANRNEEQLQLTTNASVISEAKVEFERRYGALLS